MAFGSGEHKFCDICCEPIAFLNDEFGGKEEVTSFLPGSEGSVTLNKYLRVYFIATKLFKVNSSQFIQLQGSKSGSGGAFERNGKGNVNFGGGSRLLYSSICAKCESIVDEAIGLHQKILEVQREIDKLGETLNKLKEIGQEKKKNGKKAKTKNAKLKDGNDHQVANKMLDLSLACLQLGGFVTAVPKCSTRKRSVKSVLRSKKPKYSKATRETVTSELPKRDLDPPASISSIGPDPLGSTIQPENTTEELIIKEETQELDEIISENEDEMSQDVYQPSHSSDHIFREENYENPDDDEDYVPTMSTDEEIDDDMDYKPEDLKSTNKKRKLDDEDSDNQNEDSNSNSSSDEENEIQEMARLGDVISQVKTANAGREESSSVNLEEVKYDHQCPECSRIFPRRTSLNRHTMTIHGFKSFYSCPKCPDLKFRIRKELLDHRETVHGHLCELCGHKTNKIDYLIVHYQRVHKMKFTYTCPICKMEFQRRVDLRHHRSIAHILPVEETKKQPEKPPKNDEERFWVDHPCSECGKSFLSGAKLDFHLRQRHEHKMAKKLRKEKIRKCYFCWKYFVLEQRHWIHHRSVHPDKKLEFPCLRCENTIFQSTSELLTHLKSVHPQDTIYTCTFCKWPFLNRKSLKLHKLGHINKKLDPDMADALKLPECKFNCWFCWELFETEEKRQHHLATSTRHRTRFKLEFPCDDMECEGYRNPCKSLEELGAHFEQVHSGKDTRKCDRCDWPFLSEKMLLLHKLNHIPRRGNHLKCPICDHRSTLLQALRDHYNSSHELNVKIWHCDKCDEKYVTKISLANHRQVHDKHDEQLLETGVPCDQCGKLFKSERALKSHQYQSHTQLKCTDCGLDFPTIGKLYRHKKRVHDTEKRYLCTVCGKGFHQRGLLLKHMPYHNGISYDCHICGRILLEEGAFRKHMKIHENYKPAPDQKFVCDICGIGYKRKDNLDDHKRVKHSTEGYRVWECEQCGKRFKRQKNLEMHGEKTCREKRVTWMDLDPSASEKVS